VTRRYAVAVDPEQEEGYAVAEAGAGVVVSPMLILMKFRAARWFALADAIRADSSSGVGHLFSWAVVDIADANTVGTDPAFLEAVAVAVVAVAEAVVAVAEVAVAVDEVASYFDWLGCLCFQDVLVVH
jgi:hypothetical protein